MKRQIGARYLKNQKAMNRLKEIVCTQHYKRESELIYLASGAVKRVRRYCD